jgi:hypothetical protein
MAGRVAGAEDEAWVPTGTGLAQDPRSLRQRDANPVAAAPWDDG